MKEISDQFLICKICMDVFKEPKTLSCLHTFCCACVQQQYDVESNRPTRYTIYSRSVTCPLCRKRTELPTGGVRRLQDNFLVSNLTEVLAKKCTSKVPPCEICHTVRPRSNDACSKCLDCAKLLCKTCVELHVATKVTQDHNLIDIEGQKDIECKEHPEETVRFYCEKCEMCICVVCAFQEHKDHDVCSFNDGFSKHKVTLENLLSQGRERLSGVENRLKLIDKYESISKELRERIRDLAISYTSQVRAKEKELLKKVDELFSGEVSDLIENKTALQESFDSLQSACNLTEIVMRDKGVEMLLLKKEIQSKIDHLLDSSLPPLPPDLQLDVQFIPGDVKLGEIFVPGDPEVTSPTEAKLANGMFVSDYKVTKEVTECEDCKTRKGIENREKQRMRSVYTQTRPTSETQVSWGSNLFASAASQANMTSSSSSGIVKAHSGVQTGNDGGCSTSGGTEDRKRELFGAGRETRVRGTMTDRTNVRTLKTQTEESSVRDAAWGVAASTGSSYPNTGAAIAAAFLQHNQRFVASEDNRSGSGARVQVKDTRDAEVTTEISLNLRTSADEAKVVLCQASGGGVVGETERGGGGQEAGRRPDLLAETFGAGLPSPVVAAQASGRWIRSRKVQTEVSAAGFKEGGRPFEEEYFINSMFPNTATAVHTDPIASVRQPVTKPRVQTRDKAAMTSFKVKIVALTEEKGTSPDSVQSRGVAVMTCQEVKHVQAQTSPAKLKDTASSTDYGGQMSKCTSTPSLSAVDAGTYMPPVTSESKVTWTEGVVTADRATCTFSYVTSDAATCTMGVTTGDFAVQVRPPGVPNSTNTAPPKVAHHHCQTTPSVVSRGTMPDPKLSIAVDHHLPLQEVVPPVRATTLPQSPVLVIPTFDKATETSHVELTSRCVGGGSLLPVFSNVSTDTWHLVHVADKDTSTAVVKYLDNWTLTPQPQLINTGVTPPRPAVLDVGVATMPITLMDQATYTEVQTFRDSCVETSLVVCDSETVTERHLQCDAQTEAVVSSEDAETFVEVDFAEVASMTEEASTSPTPPAPPKEIRDCESQCVTPVLLSKEVNTSRHRRKSKEVQTTYSYIECVLCEHGEKLAAPKTFSDTSTDPRPSEMHDVGTMALSCLASSPGLTSCSIQTSLATLCDKSVATSFDDEETPRVFVGPECCDASTSTESLPYIGLLSEIDVDELIVIPEANFELVSDSDSEADHVDMVDDETLTETLAYVEVGTQTLMQVGSGAEQLAFPIRAEDDLLKHVVSIGVNTMPKVTFEKETSTPMRHLFSKGTMTFYVSKMDKATSTLTHHARAVVAAAEGKVGGALGCGTGNKGARDSTCMQKARAVDDKHTMTCRADHRDVAVETDSSLLDGRITQCISKLRSVSERLNSPTSRKQAEGDLFFGKSFLTSSPASPTSPPPTSHTKGCSRFSPPRDRNVEEERQRQFRTLLAETDAVLRGKDLSPVRKVQPITTLKPRSRVRPGEVDEYASKSLPRQSSLDRQNKVKMGSQATSPSRLPLLRYNSAPGRIATVPAQTLLRKTGQTSPRTSPSKIPVSQKKSPTLTSVPASDTTPEPDTYSTSSQKTSKAQQRPSLPSISETRTPSSCSDTSTASFLSAESGDSSLNPDSVMTSLHSRTSSIVTSVSDTPSDDTNRKSSAETASTDLGEDTLSISSSSTTPKSQSVSPQKSESAPESPVKPKKEKGGGLGFMQRLLSGKRKKDSSSVTKKQEAEAAQKQQQSQQQEVAAVPTCQSPSSTPTLTRKSGIKIITTPASPPLARPTTLGTSVAPTAASVGDAALPPHHYPPLPDPNKTPPAPRKPRPFVYVRQRIFSIQQDNVEEVQEKREKEKEDKWEEVEKEESRSGKPGQKDSGKAKGKSKEKVSEKEKGKDKDKGKGSKKTEKSKRKSRDLDSDQ